MENHESFFNAPVETNEASATEDEYVNMTWEDAVEQQPDPFITEEQFTESREATIMVCENAIEKQPSPMQPSVSVILHTTMNRSDLMDPDFDIEAAQTPLVSSFSFTSNEMNQVGVQIQDDDQSVSEQNPTIFEKMEFKVATAVQSLPVRRSKRIAELKASAGKVVGRASAKRAAESVLKPPPAKRQRENKTDDDQFVPNVQLRIQLQTQIQNLTTLMLKYTKTFVKNSRGDEMKKTLGNRRQGGNIKTAPAKRLQKGNPKKATASKVLKGSNPNSRIVKTKKASANKPVRLAGCR